MKKHLLPLLIFAFAATTLQAQNSDLYSILYHERAGYAYSVCHSMQQRDGDYIIDTYLYEDLGNYNYVPVGYVYYKVSSDTHAIIDSLFVEAALPYTTFLARDPWSEGNIRATFEYREDCDSTFLRIFHFPDNDLHTNPEEDVVVPLCNGLGYGDHYGFVLDSVGDLVITYYKSIAEFCSDQYIARIGLDGTLKQQALMAENLMADIGPLRVLKESPLQYYQWYQDFNHPYTDLTVYVIDSLFHRDTVVLDGILNRELIGTHPYDSTFNIYVYEYLTINSEAEVIPAGGDDVLVAAQYTHDTNFYALTEDCGVAVAKYDLSTKQLKGYAVFNDFHWYSSTGHPLGLKMMSDGTVYFIYKEHGHPDESINIVKMDVNLNVEWKRFCKTWNINIYGWFNPSFTFEDETGEEKGVMWNGYALKDGNYDMTGWVNFFLNHDGPVNDLSEFGIEVRPYAFYPNPTQSELHLSYSPDVQPARIELYDLQGRLLHRQTQGLERLGFEGIAAGQYLMKVTLKDGKEFTDKVVKE